MDFGDPGGGNMTGIGEGGGTESVENGNGNAEGGSEYSADYDGIYIQFKDWMDRDGLNLNTLNFEQSTSPVHVGIYANVYYSGLLEWCSIILLLQSRHICPRTSSTS